MGLIAAKTTRRPIVSTLHGWVPIDTRLKVYQKCDRIALRYFDRILPVSDEMKAALIASGISSRKIIRLHNSVSAMSTKTLQREKAKQPANNRKFIVGIIGRLSPEKDVASFLKAARLLSDKYEYLQFLVVGRWTRTETS